jgi:putative NADH-flavin reductase
MKQEVLAHVVVLERLRALPETVDWFCLSPAGGYGSWNPGERTGQFRVGGDVLITDVGGNSNISGADYAIAFVDEIDKPAHSRERFTVGY